MSYLRHDQTYTYDPSLVAWVRLSPAYVSVMVAPRWLTPDREQKEMGSLYGPGSSWHYSSRALTGRRWRTGTKGGPAIREWDSQASSYLIYIYIYIYT